MKKNIFYFGVIALTVIVSFANLALGADKGKEIASVEPLAMKAQDEAARASQYTLQELGQLRKSAAAKYNLCGLIRRPGWVTSNSPEWLVVEDQTSSKIITFRIPAGLRSKFAKHREGDEIELPGTYVLWDIEDQFQLRSLSDRPAKVMAKDKIHYVVNGFATK